MKRLLVVMSGTRLNNDGVVIHPGKFLGGYFNTTLYYNRSDMLTIKLKNGRLLRFVGSYSYSLDECTISIQAVGGESWYKLGEIRSIIESIPNQKTHINSIIYPSGAVNG